MVKFQSFRAEKLATAEAAKANYQQVTTGGGQSQLEMLRALELSEIDELAHRRCVRRGWYHLHVDAVRCRQRDASGQRIGVSTLKVGSGDLTNAPLLLHLARFRLPIILSTGMATLAEVEQALGVIAFGYTARAERISDGFGFFSRFCSIAISGPNCMTR